jgi:Protein of unknwon function (DUF3310)
MTSMREISELPRHRHRRTTATGTADDSTPPYYRGKHGSLQAVDVIDEFGLDWYLGSVVTYILRHGSKNGRRDLLKAYHVLGLYLERIDPAEPDPDDGRPDGAGRGAGH